MRTWIGYTLSTLLIAGAAFGRKAPASNSGDQTNDRIEVIGHVAFDGKDVTGVSAGEHWRRNYLYLSSAGKVTVVDITNGSAPKITSEYVEPTPLHAQVVVGNVVLLTDTPAPAASIPHSISIVSFSDPAKPKVVREFTNITGYLADKRRGLIHVINNEGLWILQEQPGRDLELEKEYEHSVLYNH
jgi:hypothetical protein